MTPRVSVVMPAFDNAAFIEETIASILAQSFTDFELVISDHGSTDGTWESATAVRRRSEGAPHAGGPRRWCRHQLDDGDVDRQR